MVVEGMEHHRNRARATPAYPCTRHVDNASTRNDILFWRQRLGGSESNLLRFLSKMVDEFIEGAGRCQGHAESKSRLCKKLSSSQFLVVFPCTRIFVIITHETHAPCLQLVIF